MLARSIPAVLLVSLASIAQADAPLVGDAARGELLYATHCIACHSDKVHWRNKKLVTDWKSLQSEIDRWQDLSGLRWNQEDIADVALYLNTLYYRYPAKGGGRPLIRRQAPAAPPETAASPPKWRVHSASSPSGYHTR